MKAEVDYIFAFMTGFLGSFHCIGMCGGLVSAFFLKMGHRGAFPYISYHAGRILSYTVIGIAASALGMAVTRTGIFGKSQGIFQILAGVVVIIIGLDILRVLPWRIPFEGWMVLPKRLFKDAEKKGPLLGSFIGGVFNGFIPCTLVFTIAIKAASMGEPLQGALLMVFFGLGTIPSMLSVSLILGRIGAKARGVLFKLAAVVVIAMGVGIVYKGVAYFMIIKGLANW